ncbi:MAG: glycosyltransferase family 2 protein, partial [Mollicutes bacterium]|nr:glycosyltransferase family 2 protein [Mollicutes bacterium]
MKDIAIIIPIYNPDLGITKKFIEEAEKEFNNLIIIDDGCNEEFKDFFKSFKRHTVLTHHVNQGKGRAIKTAFNYILNEMPNIKGSVVADCDGQHSVKDIKKVAEALLKNPHKLVLGVRDFTSKDVPPRSKFGNKITINVFKIFLGLTISDTQTGLRGYSDILMPIFLKTKGERYEYETNMLIECQELDIPILEVKIRTIYIENNKTSHFNPIKDSIIIYKLFIKYILSAISSFILDIILFSIFLLLTEKILLSTILARIISSIYN